MSSLRIFLAALVAVLTLCGAGQAQTTLTALARVGAEGVKIVQEGRATEISLTLSQPVPWRVFTLDAPRRVVVDFSEVAWDGVRIINDSGHVANARTGVFQPGWSRLHHRCAGADQLRWCPVHERRAGGPGARAVQLPRRPRQQSRQTRSQ